ncbi:MAG: glycosyltransferase family 2 protein [Polyangiaceae bacterium]
MATAPRVSIVIPIYNEQAILRDVVAELAGVYRDDARGVEIILSENGSSDSTVKVAEELTRLHPMLRLLTSPAPNYGLALRNGLLAARGEFVLCEEIDLCDTDFHRRALSVLENGDADLVVGSKLLGESRDERPWLRHAASLFYTRLLHVLFDLQGTDTHGVKALRRETLLPVVHACRVDKDVFSSELVIRAVRAGVRLRELPVQLHEKRPPSINLIKRVPNVLSNLSRLAWAIHVESKRR